MKLNAIKEALIFFTSALTLVAAVSCGEEREVSRTYRGSLKELNSTIAPGVFGNVKIDINRDKFDVSVNLVNAPLGPHIQRLSIGNECPTMTDDTNGDGYIDALESQNVTGKALIPFDGDLSTQDAGATEYPVDSYQYVESAAFSTMLADLIAKDPNPEDSVTKLTAANELSFEGKVVVVHGVPAETVLPPTVQSIDGLAPQATLPIACGKMERSLSPETPGDETTTGATTGGVTTGGATTGGTTASI